MSDKSALLALTVTLIASPVLSDEKLITIRGLNVESSRGEVEAVFGKCSDLDIDGQPGFKCGDAVYIPEDGMFLPCKFVNGCEYPPEDLAKELSNKLGLSTPSQVPDTSIWIADGPAGDLIMVMDTGAINYFLQGYYVGLSMGSYKRPELTLE